MKRIFNKHYKSIYSVLVFLMLFATGAIAAGALKETGMINIELTATKIAIFCLLCAVFTGLIMLLLNFIANLILKYQKTYMDAYGIDESGTDDEEKR